MKDQSVILKLLDHRIRTSLAYSEWVERHRSLACVKCLTTENLEVHHMIDLYHIILGLWKFYGDVEAVFKHAVSYHANDMIEGYSLCMECHRKLHPGRTLVTTQAPINTDTWSVIPRMLKLIPNHSKNIQRNGTVGLITYQSLLGIGWHLMNGQIESRMLTIHRSKFAKLLGKTPGESFYASLDNAMEQLQNLQIIWGYHREGHNIEIHLSSDYLDMMRKNPWFVPMNEIKTNSMCVLCLRLWLGMQAGRRHYFIGLDKLKGHIGITIKHKAKSISAIQKALKEILWAKMKIEESLHFTISGRPPSPIRALRAILTDSLEQAN